MSETIVISVGGSLISQDEINLNFLKNFKDLIFREVTENNKKFILITGGGRICRQYQKAAADLGVVHFDPLDWIGVWSTRLNASLLQAVLGEVANPKIVTDPEENVKLDLPVTVASGWKPGWSTDYVSILLAKKIGASTVLNMSNIDHVYSDDPRKNLDAKPLKTISWDEYQKLIPQDWSPGLNSPFDPEASKKAKEFGIKVVVMSGDVDNLKKYFDNKEFEGTVIS